MFGLNLDQYKGPLHFFEEGDTINLDEDKLKIILASGHSPEVFVCIVKRKIF
jgi:glyoxylase-like metal-dependent hydrolase (beta-lactamase superfamily II)